MTRTRKAMQGVKHSNAASTCAVVRDNIHIIGTHSAVEYYIGWGEDGKLQGNAMTYSELWLLHRLIGKVLDKDSRGVKAEPHSGVTTTRYTLCHRPRTERVTLSVNA